MDVKDLMVGDIVLYLDDVELISVKVVDIDGQNIIVRVQQANGHMFNVMAESLIPSPLNTDFLRGSGFKDDENSGWLVIKESVTQTSQGGEVVLKIKQIADSENKYRVWEIKGSGQFHALIRYLNQLQNCMKIIGFKKELVLN